MRRLIAMLGTAALLVGLCGCGASAKGVTLYDSSGALMGIATAFGDTDGLTDPAYGGYTDIILGEAIAAIATATDTPVETVLTTFFKDGYSIHTAFDPAVFAALKAGYTQQGEEGLDFGTAITDHTGRLLATYSVGAENFAAAVDHICNVKRRAKG